MHFSRNAEINRAARGGHHRTKAKEDIVLATDGRGWTQLRGGWREAKEKIDGGAVLALLWLCIQPQTRAGMLGLRVPIGQKTSLPVQALIRVHPRPSVVEIQNLPGCIFSIKTLAESSARVYRQATLGLQS
jgi:hypothetical protein